MSVEEAALGALQIQKFGMTQAIELNSVRRGYDPREFTLVPGGGAGGLFACDIALELEIPRVLVPAHPGIIAATGLLTTDLQHEYVATERHALKTLDRERLERALRRARGAGRRAARRATACPRTGGWCGASPTAATPARATRCASTCPPGTIDDAWVEALAEGFHAAHEAEYGQRFDAAIEIINVRVVGIGRVDELGWSELEQGDGDPARALTMEREVVFEVDGAIQRCQTPFYERERLLRATASRGRRSSSSTTRPPSCRPASPP